MKTVKRTAQVGERVLVTNAGNSFGVYKNGDAFNVLTSRDSGLVVVQGEGFTARLHISEYEVIIEEDNHAETNEA